MKTEIERFSPCADAIAFRKKYKTFRGAWNACPRGDWMLWIAQKLDVDIRTLTLAKGYCAKTVIKLMKDQRSKDAVKAAIDFGRGKIDKNELIKAAYAAAYAAYAAHAAHAAAHAATYAAYAAHAAADAAAYAAYAAYAAHAAADAAAYAAYAAHAAAYAADAGQKNQNATAGICRKYLTKAVMEKIKIIDTN